MNTKPRYSPSDIVGTLRRVEGLVSNGASLAEAAQAVGVKYGTVYHWRRRYSDLCDNGLQKLRRLEAENARLRQSLLELESSLYRKVDA